MFCPSCGKQIPEGSAFCMQCGKPIPTVAAGVPAGPPPSPGIEAMVAQIKELLAKGAKIQAVKLYREATGAGLREAKDFVDGIEAGLPAPQPPIGTGIHRAPPAAAQPSSQPAAPTAPSAAPVQPPPASGEYVYADWELAFPPELQKRLAQALTGRGAPSVEEVRQRFWTAYQKAVEQLLQEWKDAGWQPVAAPGPTCLEMRVAKDYRDKSLLYWILMIVAIPVTAGISLLVALIPRPFAEPTRYVVKMRAPAGTAVPPQPVMPVS
jgi:hypothetical protein